jgi:DNA-binding YbaB/EbfC family protein
LNANGQKRGIVFNQLGMLAELMKNAGKLRESVQSISDLEVEGSSGGGAVTAKVNGRLEVVSVRIDPKLVEDGDTELLEDLIAAAVNAGLVKAREAMVKSLTGGLPLNLISGFGGTVDPGDEGR